jgi:hypothetical protein
VLDTGAYRTGHKGAVQVSAVELHLEGTQGPVIWNPPEGQPHAPPPRVVTYADKVWAFYRFAQPKVPENRAAWYRVVEPLRLAPEDV